jgi:hypothetical protein
MEESGGYVPANVLSRQGVTAVGGIAGGIGLFILGRLHWLVGLPLGIVAAVVGISALRSRDPGDRVPGLVITGAGVLAIAAKIPALKMLQPLAGTLLGIGAFGLLAMGIWNGIKFLAGLKKRS